jgi:hypothetical protein
VVHGTFNLFSNLHAFVSFVPIKHPKPSPQQMFGPKHNPNPLAQIGHLKKLFWREIKIRNICLKITS